MGGFFMYRLVSLRAVICLCSLLPMAMVQAATDPEMEALKQELLELKQRYEVQQKALAVLEQRVRQVENQPSSPPPKRLVKSPADLKGNQAVATGTGAAAASGGPPGAAAALMVNRWSMTHNRHKAFQTCMTRPAGSSAAASSASKPG